MNKSLQIKVFKTEYDAVSGKMRNSPLDADGKAYIA